MPKLQDAFQTIIISLPSYKDSKLEIKTNVSMEDIMESEKAETEIGKTLILAERMILSWNFQDGKGQTIPAKSDNIKQLPATDLTFLFDTIAPYVQKKTPSGKTK